MILINRTRFEQRFIPNQADIGLRLGHLVRALFPLTGDKTWALVISDEVFFNLNAVGTTAIAGFDQNRAFAGVNVTLNQHIKTEFGYLNQYVHRPFSETDRMNHIILLNLTYIF